MDLKTKKSGVAALQGGGIVRGENYTWPRVEIRFFAAGETDPTHEIAFTMDGNPSRRLRDLMPAITEFQEAMHYTNHSH